jgi:hypothetical protein
MARQILPRYNMRHLAGAAALLVALVAVAGNLSAQVVIPDEVGSSRNAGAPNAKAGSLIDLTGYWVSLVDADWRWRMMTPAKGDYASLPLNAEGRQIADSWDPAKDEREGNQCRAYGAAAIMRIPERLHIYWSNDNTLRMDTDAGMQTRLFHFDGSKWQGGAPQWQGDSVATWEKIGRVGAPVAGTGGALHVVTTHMRPGYLRKNGVPYSGDAILTEYYNRFDRNGVSYLIVTSIVDDPKYLNLQFNTSEEFKREPDASKWNPAPCRPLWPRMTEAARGDRLEH